jgi:hypothetical protein
VIPEFRGEKLELCPLYPLSLSLSPSPSQTLDLRFILYRYKQGLVINSYTLGITSGISRFVRSVLREQNLEIVPVDRLLTVAGCFRAIWRKSHASFG